MGAALTDMKDWDGAIAAYRQAFARGFKEAKAYCQLGYALDEKQDWDGAVAAYKQAIVLDPGLASAYYNLGHALNHLGDTEEAVAAYQKAVALAPKHAYAHGALARALLRLGRCAEGQEHARRALELVPEKDAVRPTVVQLQQACGHMLALEKKLSEILGGQKACNATERILLARMCEYRKKSYAAVRLYAAAFQIDPACAGDLREAHRSRAAPNAVLAAAGQSEDASSRPDKEVAALRRQALEWLRADLEASARLLGQNETAGKRLVQQRLARWRDDPDLASVRDDKALDRLSEAEHAAWRKLWRDVAALQEQSSRKPK